jgi:hypothetical protein
MRKIEPDEVPHWVMLSVAIMALLVVYGVIQVAIVAERQYGQ